MAAENKITTEQLQAWAEQERLKRKDAGAIARQRKANADKLREKKLARWAKEDLVWQKKLAEDTFTKAKKVPKRLSLLTPKQKRTRLVEYRRKFGGSVGCT